MVPRLRPEISSRDDAKLRASLAGPAKEGDKVEASVARCLRTPPAGA